MRWKLAIFDWDGTLVDSREVAYRASSEVFRHYGLQPPSFADYLREQLSDYMVFYHNHGVPRTETRRDVNVVWKKYFFDLESHPPLRSGAREILEWCQASGLKTAIVSGNIKELIDVNIERLGIGHLFDYVYADACGKTEELRHVLAHFVLPATEAFYVDDTLEGLQAAKTVGMTAIAIEGGFHERQNMEKASPDHLISAWSDLHKLLRK